METLEGVVRQTTDSPIEKFELEMLTSGKRVVAYKVADRGEGVLIETEEGGIPVYMFKMSRELLNLLRRDSEVWNG
jgi:hypothetical protein